MHAVVRRIPSRNQLSTVDVLVRTEFLRELLRLRAETNGDSPESYASRVLNPEVSESANPLDRDERTGTLPPAN